MKAFLLACLASVAVLSPLAARASESPSRVGQLVEAVWHVQSFNFVFGGYTATYSCGALARRVSSVLTTLGVLDSLTVQMLDCTDLGGGARMQITLASPVVATPENVRALTTHDARAQLIARLRNESLHSAADLERFAATWTTVSLSKDVRPRLDPGDCELIRQLRRDVLPRLSVVVLREDLHCSSGGFARYTPPRLSVSALVATDPALRTSALAAAADRRVRE